GSVQAALPALPYRPSAARRTGCGRPFAAADRSILSSALECYYAGCQVSPVGRPSQAVLQEYLPCPGNNLFAGFLSEDPVPRARRGLSGPGSAAPGLTR